MTEGPSVLLVRHGETEYNRLGRCQGWTDQPLNETGRAQAARLAQDLADRPVAEVHASPLLRAKQTAEAIAAPHEVSVQTHDQLKELYHGTLEGIPFSELDDRVPGILAQWKAAPHEVVMPEGETLADLQARAAPHFETLARSYATQHHNGGPTGALVLVAHALTISTIVCHLKREGLEQMRGYRLDHCGYWDIRHDDEAGWRVHGAQGLMPAETRV